MTGFLSGYYRFEEFTDVNVVQVQYYLQLGQLHPLPFSRGEGRVQKRDDAKRLKHLVCRDVVGQMPGNHLK